MLGQSKLFFSRCREPCWRWSRAHSARQRSRTWCCWREPRLGAAWWTWSECQERVERLKVKSPGWAWWDMTFHNARLGQGIGQCRNLNHVIFREMFRLIGYSFKVIRVLLTSPNKAPHWPLPAVQVYISRCQPCCFLRPSITQLLRKDNSIDKKNQDL